MSTEGKRNGKTEKRVRRRERKWGKGVQNVVGSVTQWVLLFRGQSGDQSQKGHTSSSVGRQRISECGASSQSAPRWARFGHRGIEGEED